MIEEIIKEEKEGMFESKKKLKNYFITQTTLMITGCFIPYFFIPSTLLFLYGVVNSYKSVKTKN